MKIREKPIGAKIRETVSSHFQVEIIGEASLVHRHTSVLLDLKSRAYELEFMNVIVDEDPIIPYEVRAEIKRLNVVFLWSQRQRGIGMEESGELCTVVFAYMVTGSE